MTDFSLSLFLSDAFDKDPRLENIDKDTLAREIAHVMTSLSDINPDYEAITEHLRSIIETNSDQIIILSDEEEEEES